MVTLTRITGTQFALNPDLIERVDRTPDTVITLVDGTKYLVREGLDEVVAAIMDYRASVLARASFFERVGDATARRTRLSAVPQPDDTDDADDTDEAEDTDAEAPGVLAELTALDSHRDDNHPDHTGPVVVPVVPVVPLTPRNA